MISLKMYNSGICQHPPLNPYYFVNRDPSEDGLALSKVHLSSFRARLNYLNMKYFFSLSCIILREIVKIPLLAINWKTGVSNFAYLP